MSRNLFKNIWLLLCIGLLTLLPFSISAQSEEEPDRPEITAENITQLQSVATIDFADFTEELGDMTTGWVAVSQSGQYMVVVNSNNRVSVLNVDGTYIGSYEITADDDINMLVEYIHFVDGWNNAFAAIHSDGKNHKIAFVAINELAGFLVNINTLDFPFAPDAPISMWTLENDSGPRVTEHMYFETISSDPSEGSTYIAHFPVWADGTRQADHTGSNIQGKIPYEPANDPDAQIRIGRIPLPFVITTSMEGIVTRWSIPYFQDVIETQVENGPAVFGQINVSGSHFTWRNPMSENINLLNFETGENQVVAPLDGEYFNWFFVSNDASVILGITPEERPEIVAWIVETGERILIGEYRQCSRQPDMVRLSQDGTTLVIGCDTGLDIWRTVND